MVRSAPRPALLDAFELVGDRPYRGTGEEIADAPPSASVDLKAQIRAMWQ
jgi:hypothetical protein